MPHDHRRAKTPAVSVATLDRQLIERIYDRAASVYDCICGPILHAGRREAVRSLGLQPGDHVLEVGIGTGLTMSLYPARCRVTGIDVSQRMLDEADRQARKQGWSHIELRRMDATTLRFANESFDVVYAAYVMSVVTDPVEVLREMRRVCRVGGHIVLLNHFLSWSPMLAWLERLISPLSARVGFRADLDLSSLLAQAELVPLSIHKVNTPSIWSLVRCRRY